MEEDPYHSDGASTLEETESEEEGSMPELESLASTDDDCVLSNSLMEASETGNYQEFVDLAIGAEEFMLNWSLTVAKTVDIVRFLVEEKECFACIGDCYMNAAQKGYTDVVHYIESLDQHMPSVVQDTVGETVGLLGEIKGVVPSALVRLFERRKERSESTEEDILVIRAFQKAADQLLRLLKDQFPETLEAWSQENEIPIPACDNIDEPDVLSR